MIPLVTIRGLRVRFGDAEGGTPALAGIDLDIGHGETLAVIGESGSGKSTLALAIASLLPAGASTDGIIEWPQLSRRPVNGRDLGFIFQSPAGSLDPVVPVGEQIAEVVVAHRRMAWRQALTLAHDLLERVGLPDPASLARVYAHQLSGGQKQRVAIAAALAGEPALLIADEATSALDTIVQKQIVDLLLDLKRERGMALLFISHDIALAAQIADRIAVLRDGRLVEVGETAALLAAPSAAYTRSLLDACLGLETIAAEHAGTPQA